MVKLSTKLPKEHERNGLDSDARRLLDNYQSGDTIIVVAVVRTKDVHNTEDYERVPRVEIVAIEPAISEADEETLREWLNDLHDQRVAHVKQPLDLPDTDTPATAEPLALEAGDVVDAELVEDGELVGSEA